MIRSLLDVKDDSEKFGSEAIGYKQHKSSTQIPKKKTKATFFYCVFKNNAQMNAI